MNQVVIKFSIFNNKGSRYTEIENYTDMIHEWITNGANGSKEDVLSNIREGTYGIHELSTSDIAYGFLESLWQSDRCPRFIMEDENLTIKVETLVNEYMKGESMSQYEIVKVSFNKDEEEIVVVVRDKETDEYYTSTLYSSDIMNSRLLEKVE